MSYAEGTLVSVERTRAEIETLVLRKGAEQVGYNSGTGRATVGFIMHGKQIQFFVPLPTRDEERFKSYKRGYSTFQRTPEQSFKLWEQACRERWRALLLCIKAKLEAVDAGITSFEYEFMAHFVASDGRTIAEHILPSLNAICDGSRLLTFGEQKTTSR